MRAVAVPERGGQTLFTNQYAACETLPRRLRTFLEGRTITHVVTGVSPDGRQESAATHPIAASYIVPITTALSAIACCIAGWSPQI